MSLFSSSSVSSLTLSDIDFDWVSSCTEVALLRRAILLLQTEYFPELLKAAESRLSTLMKKNGTQEQSKQQSVNYEEAKKAAEEIEVWSQQSKKKEAENKTQGKIKETAKIPIRGTTAQPITSSSVPSFNSSIDRDLYVSQLKSKGNECFRCGEFERSAEFYKSALNLSTTDHTIFTNLAMAHIRLKAFDQAISIGEKCLKDSPNNLKAHWRVGQALIGNKNYEKALKHLTQALNLLQAGEADSAHSNDANKKEIERLIAECRKYEGSYKGNIKEEKENKVRENSMKRMIIEEEDENDEDSLLFPSSSSVSSAEIREVKKLPISSSNFLVDHSKDIEKSENLKTQGNQLFKDGQFEKAIERFTSALESLSAIDNGNVNKIHLLKLPINPLLNQTAAIYYSNISLCYQQLQRFAIVVDFVSRALELISPSDSSLISSSSDRTLLSKLLLRRALAYESLGSMRSALTDLQRLLSLEYSPAVAQHRERLSKAVTNELIHEAKDSKVRGNQAFSLQLYNEALSAYGKGISALEALNGKSKADQTLLSAQLLSNRAICHIKNKNFQSAREDAQSALKALDEIQPNQSNEDIVGLRVKSLYRCGLALLGLELSDEAIERLEAAQKLQSDPNTTKELERAKQMKAASSAKPNCEKSKTKKPLIEVLE
jgi:tetratricopeptide (TPR) repeat protein